MNEATDAQINPGETRATLLTPEQLIRLGMPQPENQKFLRELQDMRAESDNPEQDFEALKIGPQESRRISKSDRQKVRDNIDSNKSNDVERIQNEIDILDLYTYVVGRAQREGKKPQDILESLSSNKEWSDLEREALGILMKTRALSSIFPPGLEEEDIKEIIKKAILNDPKYAEVLSELYKSTVAQLDSLPKPEEPEGLKEEKRKRDRCEATYKKLIESLSSQFGLTYEEITDILNIYPSGTITSRVFLEHIFQIKLRRANISNDDQASIFSIIKAQEQLQQLEEKIFSLTEQLVNLDSKDKNYRNTYNNLRSKIKELEELKRKAETKAKIEDEDLQKKVDEIKFFREEVFGENKGRDSIIDMLLRNYSGYIEAKDKIETFNQANQEYVKQKETRTLREEEFLKQFEAIINDSLVELVKRRNEEWRTISQRLMEKEKDDLLRSVGKSQSERYKRYDGKRNIYNRSHIGSDMRLVADYQDDGIRIIIAQALDLKFKNNNNNYCSVTKPEDLESLDKEDRAKIEHVFTNQKGQILANLFTSYYEARLFYDRSLMILSKFPFGKGPLFEGRLSNMALTEAQWERLGKVYNSDLEAALNTSKQGAEAVKKLNEMGLKPGRKFDVLMNLLIIAGLIGLVMIILNIKG